VHEVAAYKLDRLLELGLVPVTVARKVDGTRGALQVFLEEAVDLPYIREHGRFDLVAGLEAEIQKARVFAALIGARERMDAAKMVLPLRRRIMIADHTRGFPLTADVEEILNRHAPELELAACKPMDAYLELVLRKLTRKELHAELHDELSDGQLDALLERRDRILERCGSERLATGKSRSSR